MSNNTSIHSVRGKAKAQNLYKFLDTVANVLLNKQGLERSNNKGLGARRLDLRECGLFERARRMKICTRILSKGPICKRRS